MSLLSSLFSSSKKSNLTPNTTPLLPYQIDPETYGNLSTFANKRIQAGNTGEETQGVGFGKDFLGKATNPAISQIDYNFNNRTMPLINSQLSARGVARSAGGGLATDVIGQADQQRNRDIDNLVSQFYALNEQQKKNDITQGVGVGQGLLSGDVAAQHDQAAASERLANATAAQNNYAQGVNQQRAGNLVQAGAQMLPAAGGFMQTLSQVPQLGALSGMFQGAGNFLTGAGQSVKTQTLGSQSTQDLLRQLLSQ